MWGVAICIVSSGQIVLQNYNALFYFYYHMVAATVFSNRGTVAGINNQHGLNS